MYGTWNSLSPPRRYGEKGFRIRNSGNFNEERLEACDLAADHWKSQTESAANFLITWPQMLVGYELSTLMQWANQRKPLSRRSNPQWSIAIHF